jgi:hypothetical protein
MDIKEFVSNKQSDALAELNYDGDYDFTYHATGELWERIKKAKVERHTPAPLKQQAFRWFRDKYDAHIHPTKLMPGVYIIHYGTWTSITYNTYEEAESACIDKFIEIAKQQDNGKSNC